MRGLPFGFVHGSMAPWLSDFDGSGITRFRSKSIVLPNPWHLGQAPNGLLKENSRGSGSSYLMPHFLHSNRWENRNCWAGFPSGGAVSKTTSPLSRKLISAASATRERDSA